MFGKKPLIQLWNSTNASDHYRRMVELVRSGNMEHTSNVRTFFFPRSYSTSTGLLHWRLLPDAIGSGNGDEGCFSDTGFVKNDGTALISHRILWGDMGTGIAKSRDHDFEKWEKFPWNPFIRSD